MTPDLSIIPKMLAAMAIIIVVLVGMIIWMAVSK